MFNNTRVSRRDFLHGAGLAALSGLLPSWAMGQVRKEPGTEFSLEIGETPVTIGGRSAVATGRQSSGIEQLP